MGKNDKYGPRTDLSSLLQQTSESVSKQPLEPAPIPTSVMTDCDYIQQLNSYLDKQTAILDRIERLEVFVESQEERKQARDDLYSKHVKSLVELAQSLTVNRDFILDATDRLSEISGKLESVASAGIEISPESLSALDDIGESVTNKLNDYLPDKFNELTNDIGKTMKTSADSLSEAADDIRSFKWVVVVSVIWGLIGTFFAIGTLILK
ncbi:MAG: hypothetical protein IJV19_05775 [Prevotella sp.]|nr:hypothetical protein [Prevotella sp.]MBQ8457903.1 hypothetical protein [Prevotella sp.]